MAMRDREFPVIIKGCQEFAAAIEEARTCADTLSKGADIAEGTLKDRVAKKHIDAIRELCEAIKKATAVGEERVRELERKTKADQARFEDLER